MKRLFTALLLSFCVGLSSMAYAEALTSDQVGRFIASMRELEALGDKYQDSKRRKIDRNRPLSSGLEQMQGKGPEYAALGQLAASHGFASAEQYADVGDRTVQAYSHSASNRTPEEIETLYQEGVARIKKNPSLSDEHKEGVLRGMEKAHKRNTQARAAAEKDFVAVRPHKAELDKLFK